MSENSTPKVKAQKYSINAPTVEQIQTDILTKVNIDHFVLYFIVSCFFLLICLFYSFEYQHWEDLVNLQRPRPVIILSALETLLFLHNSF